MHYLTLRKTLSKQQYRSELGTISEILGVIIDYGRGGAIISSISTRANLSYYSAMEKCKKLVGAGLVEPVNNDKYRIFMITEKGIGFFHQMQRFIEIAQEIKIRY